jgi:hypothetical protein
MSHQHTRFTIRKIAIFAFVLHVWTFLGAASAQSIQAVSVTAHGIGASEAEAIQQAVINAVAMVSGERINVNQSTRLSTKEQANSSGQASEQSTVEIKQRIDRLTNGVVKSWSVVGTKRSAGGGVHATVKASIAVYQAGEGIKRFRVAVVPGRTAGGSSVQPGSEIDAVISGISEILVSSKKFAVLDRREGDAIRLEHELISSGKVPVEETIRLRSKAAAEALISISGFMDRVQNDQDRPLKLTIEATVVDHATGQIKGIFNKSRRLNISNARTISLQIGKALGDEILEFAFPPTVIGIDGEFLTLDAGDPRLKVGEIIRIVRLGAAVKDPATGESRGFTEIPVGNAKVIHSTPLISVASIDSKLVPVVQSGQGYIARREVAPSIDVRAIVQPGGGSQGAPSSNSQQPSREGKKYDKDW